MIGQRGAHVLSTLNLGVFQNLHVLLWRRINDTEKIQSQELQNGNLSIFVNIYKDSNQNLIEKRLYSQFKNIHVLTENMGSGHVQPGAIILLPTVIHGDSDSHSGPNMGSGHVKPGAIMLLPTVIHGDSDSHSGR